MKALFSRLHRNKDKDSKTSPPLAPQPSQVDNEKQTYRLPPYKGMMDDFVNARPSSNAPSSRPLSQLEISMQKPLPAIHSSPALDDILKGITGERDKESASIKQKEHRSTLSASGADVGSHGRSTSSKPSTSANTESSMSNLTNTTANVKKVAFISPPPTPAALSNTQELPSDVTIFEERRAALQALVASSGTSSSTSPYANNSGDAKSTSTTRVHLDSKQGGQQSPLSAIPPKINTAIKATMPRNREGGSAVTATVSPSHSTRNFASPTPEPNASLRAGTPFSHMTGRGAIQAAASWSEAAEDDLVSNLGPRERTRQEVLWEIVVSEQRYVTELLKLKETFVEPLLHPFATSPLASTSFGTDPEDHYYASAYARAASPAESVEHLPIASRFLSPTPRPPSPGMSAVSHGRSIRRNETPVIPPADGDSLDTDDDDLPAKSDTKVNKERSFGKSILGTIGKGGQASSNSPYGTRSASRGPAAPSSGMGTASRNHVPFPARSHQSLPPAPRVPASASTASLGKQSALASERERLQEMERSRKAAATPTSRLGRKLRKPGSGGGAIPGLVHADAIPPNMLPEDLRKCLEVLDRGVLKGHLEMCEALKRRYDEQYPLVRSLADVFVKHASILQGYATYVLHLEKALEQVDNALSTAYSSKKPKDQDAADWARVSRVLRRLEETAADKGETGLAISLSKPFQRLLKYPLMFQNLLFHTDPSTFEYEATLQMVAEVETIVRSIEDEKIQKEERDKTRDVWARIEGLEKVKMLAIPKSSRLLVEERQMAASEPTTAAALRSMTGAAPSASPTPSAATKSIKNRSSFKRLSDVLQSSNSLGGKNDVWLVVFNDVVIRCQRTGTTCLPLATGSTSRSNSLPEFNKNSKYGTAGRRASQNRPRNLYKFIKVETWTIGNVIKPQTGMVSMEDISRSRGAVAIQPVKSGDTDDEGGNDSDDSDRKSKMSFSYWGADKITMSTPSIAKSKLPGTATPTNGRSTPARKVSAIQPGFTRTESSVQAKFANRLRGGDDYSPPVTARSLSRARQQISGSSQSTAVSASRPDDTLKPKERPASRASATVATRTPNNPMRRIHQASTASSSTAPVGRNKIASPAPSHDSGVVWADPSIHRF